MSLFSQALIAAVLAMCSAPTAAQNAPAPDTGSPQAAAASQEAAMARFPLVYVVRYRPGPAYQAEKPLLRQNLRDHEVYMRRQTEAGVIIAAGPTFDEAGGLVLIKAASRQEAEAFIRTDPAVIAGVFAGEATDWRPVFDAGAIFRSAQRPSN
ncbi:uncharacterized protein YciI [Phenylobacterium haematophilum]|uniref:Uncharacterized protein YciI n=1 Tax=Phenylobacterium haematophilum TaxID=98513 RepID=A0A839ZZ47_9CAUL|nr:YciI family protein [Phenylobacterium haematophilum]MBB3890621.1 uncharacterized protein YciI [Phenylobacterium haematophilum]